MISFLKEILVSCVCLRFLTQEAPDQGERVPGQPNRLGFPCQETCSPSSSRPAHVLQLLQEKRTTLQRRDSSKGLHVAPENISPTGKESSGYLKDLKVIYWLSLGDVLDSYELSIGYP